jgi:hypothetical protein
MSQLEIGLRIIVIDLILLSRVGTTCFSSSRDKDSTILFTTDPLRDGKPSWQ